MRRVNWFLVGSAALLASVIAQAGPITYSSVANLASLTNGYSNYATFMSALYSNPPSMLPAWTPSAATLAQNPRFVGGNQLQNSPVIVQFAAPVPTIRVFPNIDHPSDPLDGYQYSISGSNDGVTWAMLFDPTAVNMPLTTSTGAPVTLAGYNGTAPLQISNIMPPPAPVPDCPSPVNTATGPCGYVGGYVSDFVFSSSYKYYAFSPSTLVSNPPGNEDPDFSAVASTVLAPFGTPEPSTGSIAVLGLGLLGLARYGRKFRLGAR